jgi:hypothetical protein
MARTAEGRGEEARSAQGHWRTSQGLGRSPARFPRPAGDQSQAPIDRGRDAACQGALSASAREFRIRGVSA